MKVLIGNSKTPLEFKKSPKDGWWEAEGFVISPNLKTCHESPWFVLWMDAPVYKFVIIE